MPQEAVDLKMILASFSMDDLVVLWQQDKHSPEFLMQRTKNIRKCMKKSERLREISSTDFLRVVQSLKSKQTQKSLGLGTAPEDGRQASSNLRDRQDALFREVSIEISRQMRQALRKGPASWLAHVLKD